MLYEDCGDNGGRYVIAADHLAATELGELDGGFAIEVQTPHDVLHDVADDLVAGVDVVGWP